MNYRLNFFLLFLFSTFSVLPMACRTRMIAGHLFPHLKRCISTFDSNVVRQLLTPYGTRYANNVVQAIWADL